MNDEQSIALQALNRIANNHILFMKGGLMLPVRVITVEDVADLAHQRYGDFILPSPKSTEIAKNTDMPAVVDMTHFPHFVELRTRNDCDRLTLAISSSVDALQMYAAKHEIPIFAEDEPSEPLYDPTLPNEETFGGMPGDLEQSPDDELQTPG